MNDYYINIFTTGWSRYLVAHLGELIIRPWETWWVMKYITFLIAQEYYNNYLKKNITVIKQLMFILSQCVKHLYNPMLNIFIRLKL